MSDSSLTVSSSSPPLALFEPEPQSRRPRPLPLLPIATRLATMEDLAFIDGLQKQHHRELGFFPRAQMEGYIKNGWVIVAEEKGVDSSELIVDSEGGSPLSTNNYQPSTLLGYCASRDRYLKRDELGAIFQLCIVPGKQRGLIGASLLKDVFERASYGTRLFCCWCAQDLQANHFWEAMGFVPLAFRTGGRRSGVGGRRSERNQPLTTHDSRPTNVRVHIFWEKRIRSDDVTTPWWFPSQTAGGSIREDRLVLPIPPGTRWKDVMPVILPQEQGETLGLEDQTKKPIRKSGLTLADAKAKTSLGHLQFVVPREPKAAPKAKVPRKKIKHDPKHIAAARELRDRWLEKVNENPSLLPAGKYDVSRLPSPTREPIKMLAA